MYSTPELRNHEISSIPLQNPKDNETPELRKSLKFNYSMPESRKSQNI